MCTVGAKVDQGAVPRQPWARVPKAALGTLVEKGWSNIKYVLKTDFFFI